MQKNLYLFFLLIIFIFSSDYVFSQTKSYNIERIENNIVIDGNLDDSAWLEKSFIDNFIQYEPYNGKHSSHKTEVKIVYNNEAIYICAKLYDVDLDSISVFLSKRDELGQSDYFGVYIDPFNLGLSSYGFFVTAAGVQVDKKLNLDAEDVNWDAIWKSRVKITDFGWQVEIEIPYSALRFPAKDNQIWAVNFYRNIQRIREISTWNLINPKISGRSNQSGLIYGINNIEAPFRLSVLPYFSYYTQFEDNKIAGYQAIGGLDLKYGLNESFTLDMMLIPDFGDIQSDDKVLNLSAYETYYDEKRSFFTEGIELFQKGGIFYSRRIGTKPLKYNTINNELRIFERLENNPEHTQIINATKLSGKTNNGVGIGILNAMTSNSYATTYDTLNRTSRKLKTNPFTNYNIFVVDKSLKNNSYISFINTNVSMPENYYFSDVSAFDTKFSDRKTNYAISSKAAVSQIFSLNNAKKVGYFYQVNFSKISGNFRFSLTHKELSENYNPNDLGFLANNNLILDIAGVSYNIYKPFWKLLYIKNSLSYTNSKLYSSNKYISTEINFVSYTSFKNHFSLGLNLNFSPINTYDYFESRVENRVFVLPPNQNYSTWISTDYTKIFAFDANIGYYNSIDKSMNIKGGWYSFSPRIRLNNKLLIIYSFKQEIDFNSFGYFTKSNNEDTIYFGQRDISTITNSIKTSYILNNKSSFDLKIRHYWSVVNYVDFFTLQTDGSLRGFSKSYKYLQNSDINYNTFNIDFIYNLQFAPGSEISLVWKNYIFTNENEIIGSYFKNFDKMIENKQVNSLSFKLIFYLDYKYLSRFKP